MESAKRTRGRPAKAHILIQMRMAADLVRKIEMWRAGQAKKIGAIPTRTRAIEILIEQGLR